MLRVMGGAALTAVMVTPAAAGGLERSSQSVGVLFEKGTYAEVTISQVDPDVSGNIVAVPSIKSGDLTEAYTSWSLAFKTPLSEKLDLALIVDQPIGADVKYPALTDTPFPFGGGYTFGSATADVNSSAVTMLARYKLPDNFSVYGGLRMQSVEGEVFIPIFNNYATETETSRELGYVIGAAWEKPEIAARVALTYNSAITHELDAREYIDGNLVNDGSFKTEIPQSLNLEFQTGIAADTLLFGSIRWQEWSKTDITPDFFTNVVSPGSSLVDYENDVITYNIGLGRRFNENWSGAITAGYEKSNGGFVGNLGPTDGFTSMGLAATYTQGNIKVTGGVRYIWIGDADTQAFGNPLGEFKDNNGFAYGLRIGYSF